MKDSLNTLKNIEINISFIPPKNLQKLAEELKGNSSSKITFENREFIFPLLSIDILLDSLIKEEFKKLNFFDILRLLNEMEEDTLKSKIKDKIIFVQLFRRAI